MLQLPHEMTRQGLMVHAEVAQSTVQPAPVYDDAGKAAAYSVMRMPACYAVAFRVLRELRLARPNLSPSSLLDFGSGPGTAIWAAQQVSASAARPPAIAVAGHSCHPCMQCHLWQGPYGDGCFSAYLSASRAFVGPFNVCACMVPAMPA